MFHNHLEKSKINWTAGPYVYITNGRISVSSVSIHSCSRELIFFYERDELILCYMASWQQTNTALVL